MIEVNLFDLEFIHTDGMFGYITASDTLKPTRIKWLNGLMVFDGITVFTDRFVESPIVDQVECKLKVYWLLESKAVNTYCYDLIKLNEHRFDYILTHDEELLARNPSKYIKSLVGASRVSDEEACIYSPKTKLVSMIASNKTQTDGHRYRHQIANLFADKYNIDMWGSGYKRFNNKSEPLKDYCYTISVINTKNNNFFTEVLLDCYRYGNAVIFYGCDNIGEYFDTRGMLIFNNNEELEHILKNVISFEDYNNRMEYIKHNFIESAKYVSIDDLLADVLVTLPLNK
jgi:hypothetical protein